MHVTTIISNGAITPPTTINTSFLSMADSKSMGTEQKYFLIQTTATTIKPCLELTRKKMKLQYCNFKYQVHHSTAVEIHRM